jgi:hypothetical protein
MSNNLPFDLHHVGVKFNRDGSVRHYPGNTILCHVPRPGVLWSALIAARDQLNAGKAADRLTFLPPESYHMTVFEGVTDHIRAPLAWPADVQLDAPVDQCTRRFEQKLARFDPACELPLRMVIADGSAQHSAGVMTLTPIDAEENRKLRTLRDRLSDCLSIRHPIHNDYVFHITLAYPIKAMTPAATDAYLKQQAACFEWIRRQVPVVEFGPPEFCVFDDMHAFETRLYLGSESMTPPPQAAHIAGETQ